MNATHHVYLHVFIAQALRHTDTETHRNSDTERQREGGTYTHHIKRSQADGAPDRMIRRAARRRRTDGQTDLRRQTQTHKYHSDKSYQRVVGDVRWAAEVVQVRGKG